MRIVILAAMLAVPTVLAAQMPNPEALKQEQVAKMSPFAMIDGTWRGTAVIQTPQGQLQLTQTERVGPMLDGAARVIEGRGYTQDGKLAFNAFATLTFNPATSKFEMHALSDGRVGVFPVEPRADGFVWETPAGPGKVRYVATVKDGVWTETGDFEMPGAPPRRFITMTLKRLGDTDWPSASSVPPK